MKKTLLCAALTAALGAVNSQAEPIRVQVTIENLAPERGTFQTPHWVGFHDGTFDIYNGGTPASILPQPGSVAVERLAEDGNTGPLADDFAFLAPAGVDATIPGPNGPLGPGEITSQSFVIESTDINQRYFSYASMVIPSNDFWYANGNPLAHPIFDNGGNFIAEDFFVTQDDVLDAGTEVNDEIPANTAFFGQAAPDTGVDENGVILDFGDPSGLVAFRQPEDGGNILADSRFAMADFAVPGYPLVKFSFTAAPAIIDDETYTAVLDGDQEVPPSGSRARGTATYELEDDGTRLSYSHRIRALRSITMAHLHLAPAGANGPIVAFLLTPGEFDARRARRGFEGELTAADLIGPLAGQPLDALIAEIEAGNIYINIHSEQVPSGEIRGQLTLAE